MANDDNNTSNNDNNDNDIDTFYVNHKYYRND